MKILLTGAAVALSLALSSAAWASMPDLALKLQQATDQGDFQQRKDVDEVTRSPPPTGPASQNLTCSPSRPDCP
jgi:hypothetical protein